MKKQKDKRSNKWAFLIYKESTPSNYMELLENLHVPFVLSPWHDKDIHSDTGEIKKHINMAHFILIHLKVTHRYLNLYLAI